MRKICIQAGHQNVKYNSIVSLRGSTGAPNEMSFNIDIRDKVSDQLRKRGFSVVGTDANANDDVNIISQDWDLFLSIHYDADVYSTEPKNGGFADYPEPSTDGVTVESQRITKIFNKTYFDTTKIPCVTRRSNVNTRYFYMWKYLSSKTPCVILECGVGMHTPEDHQTLHFNRPLVVEGIVRSICEAFGVAYEPQEPVDPCENCKQELLVCKQNSETMSTKLEKAQMDLVSANNAKTTSDIRVKELEEELEGVRVSLNEITSDRNALNELLKAREDEVEALSIKLADCKATCNQPTDIEDSILTKIADWIKKILGKLK